GGRPRRRHAPRAQPQVRRRAAPAAAPSSLIVSTSSQTRAGSRRDGYVRRMTKRRMAKEIAAWILSLFLCFLFARAGIAKFDDASGWSAMFRAWGFPLWFRLFIGVWET